MEVCSVFFYEIISQVRPQEQTQERHRKTVYDPHRSEGQEALLPTQGHMGKPQGGAEAESRKEQGGSWGKNQPCGFLRNVQAEQGE